MVNIKKKTTLYLLFLILAIFVLNPIMVKAESSRIFDHADLFSQEEITELDEEANVLSNNYNMDIVIVTTNDASGKTSREYADDYYDDNEFSIGDDQSGILFLMDMDNREVYISTTGQGIRYLTDQRIESVLESVIDSGMGDGDYYSAARGFLNATEEYLESGIPSDQYSQDEGVEVENSLTFIEGIISFISGLIAAAGFFFITKSRYKMKNPEKPLTFRNNSLVSLALSQDDLIDTAVTRRKIPKPSSDSGKSTTHESSSGETHGGGGSKF